MKQTLSYLIHWSAFTLLIASLLVPAVASQTPEAPPADGRLVLLSKLDGPPLPADLKILEDYDAFVLAELPEAQIAALPQANVLDRMTDRTVLSLNGWVWDTQEGEPPIAESLRSARDEHYFLVQFYAPVKNEWVSDLGALGVAFLGYHPNYTYIVRMEPALVEKVQAAHAVQWVGRYHPACRLASEEELAKTQTEGDRLALGRASLPRRGCGRPAVPPGGSRRHSRVALVA